MQRTILSELGLNPVEQEETTGETHPPDGG